MRYKEGKKSSLKKVKQKKSFSEKVASEMDALESLHVRYVIKEG